MTGRLQSSDQRSNQSYSLIYFLVHRIYTIAITPSRNQYIRTLCLTSVVSIFILRAQKLWLWSAVFIAVPALVVASAALGLPAALFLLFTLPSLVILYLVHTHPDDGIGHRVGFEGYTGIQIENTTAAVEALATADAAGEYDYSSGVHFPFIEFDVRETKDGELVLFHDLGLKLAFPCYKGENTYDDGNGGGGGADRNANSPLNINIKPLRALAEQGIDWHTASIEDLTLEQVQTLHLGGREGQHVPTLEQFLE
jgi:Glycerophosphoryl diester phosphodiesterase family